MGHEHGEVERGISTDERSRPHDRVGHFISGVGSIVPEYEHGGTLVHPRENQAHQLPGASSSHVSPKNDNLTTNNNLTTTPLRERETNCSFHSLNCIKRSPLVQSPDGYVRHQRMQELIHPCLELILSKEHLPQQHLELALLPVIFSKQQIGTRSQYSNASIIRK